MVILNVNDQQFELDVNPETTLLTVLRQHLKITSVKNGCNEGVCGACMVLIDGKTRQSCSLSLKKLGDKPVMTVEGIRPEELTIYTEAFARAGAVQCGFCTPGMVISAKGILDQNASPTREEIAVSLRKNLCRCTGYQKIIDAIELAGRALRGEEQFGPLPEPRIGERYPRRDAYEKTAGKAVFADDLSFPNMLYGAVIRSPVARAKIISIDTSEVEKMPGVAAVLTAKDIPGSLHHGLIFNDWPTLIEVGQETRYVGDALVLVAAETPEAASMAVQAIKLEYKELEPVTDVEAAIKEGAPGLHPKGNILSTTRLKRGDVNTALKDSAHLVSCTYEVPFTEHAFLEPESAVAVPKGQEMTLYVGTQSVFEDQHQIAEILNITPKKLRVVNCFVGGAFGGKEDLSVQHHAALLAWKTKRPVKLTLSRRESLMVHPKRHAMKIEMTTGVDGDGRLTGLKARILADTGAYASMGAQVLERACTHATGPYRIDNLEIEGSAIYTNNPPAGAFRGFGVPQAAFANESQMDQLAELVGIDPWEIRWRNALEPGDRLATGQKIDNNVGLKKTLEAVREVCNENSYVGIACGMKSIGLGVGTPDVGRVKAEIKGGKVVLATGAACIGQGLEVALLQIFCQTSGLPAELVELCIADSGSTPASGTTTASRQSLFTGEAVRRAAVKVKDAMGEGDLSALEGMYFDADFEGVTDRLNSEKEDPITHIAYGFATQVVVLNEEGRLKKVLASHDVGKALNPLALEGQIEGAVVMGVGYALRENFATERGIPKQQKMASLGLWKANETPEIEVLIHEGGDLEYAYGAKGIGEIATIPTAAAVANAYRIFDGERRLSLPLENTPYQRKNRR